MKRLLILLMLTMNLQVHAGSSWGFGSSGPEIKGAEEDIVQGMAVSNELTDELIRIQQQIECVDEVTAIRALRIEAGLRLCSYPVRQAQVSCLLDLKHQVNNDGKQGVQRFTQELCQWSAKGKARQYCMTEGLKAVHSLSLRQDAEFRGRRCKNIEVQDGKTSGQQ